MNTTKRFTLLLAVGFALSILHISALNAQYWQQSVDYNIQCYLTPENHKYAGEEVIEYVNNSPDTLTRIYFHLYPNAFQPGSMMDVRNLNLPDPDRRVGDRISKLSPEGEGHLHITKLMQGSSDLTVIEEETIAYAELQFPIKPGGKANFKLNFEGQVPEQIRRSGRNNAEGVDYSMPQWYPKLSEYDHMGWHPNPYVGREFHGIWGDFDVTVALPNEYTYAGTGYPADAPKKFYNKKIRKKIKKGDYVAHRRTAPMVHDFTWAADTEYKRTELKRADGTMLEFYYIPGEKTTENWELLPEIMDKAFDFINKKYGQYPYEKYAIIQGGDGGMEYAMSTLITGERTLGSLVGVSVHELMHSWYQFVLATNESLYPWMDEGFTSYASSEVMKYPAEIKAIPRAEVQENPHLGTVLGYSRFANTGRAEALSTHADHYTTNAAYGVGSYVKGELFLYQLRGIIGEEAFDKGMLRYFNTWKMKHPTAQNFIRIMEKVSGQELDWYLEYMVNTTHQIDFTVDTIYSTGAKETTVVLRKLGVMPAPVDVQVTDRDGNKITYLVPLVLQRGHAPLNGRELADDWPWTNPTYTLTVPMPFERIAGVEIDPAIKLSEANKENNVYPPLVIENN